MTTRISMDNVWLDSILRRQCSTALGIDDHALAELLGAISRFVARRARGVNVLPAISIADGRMRRSNDPDYHYINVEDFVALVRDGVVSDLLARLNDGPLADRLASHLEANFE